MRWLETKIVYSVGFGVVVLLAIGAGLLYWTEVRKARPHVVKVAYGSDAPVRKRFLDQLAAQAKKRNLEIRLVPTAGTDQTLSAIADHSVDLGLIAGVVEDRSDRRALEVTPLYMEPLQLLVKAEIYEAVIKDFGALRGKTIDLDSENSATHLLAAELLRFMGLTDEGTGRALYQPVFISPAALAAITDREIRPDAIFQIGGVPSSPIRNEIVHHNYRLVPLPFGASFNLDKFRDAEAPPGAAASNLRLNKDFIEEAVIPEFVYSVLPAVPPADTRTIATRLVLIGSDRLESQVVHQLLDVIFAPEVSNFAHPALTVDILNTNFQFDRHPGTDAYVRSLQPVDVESAFVAYGRLAEVWGLIITLYIAAAKGLKMWRDRKVANRRPVGDFLEEVLAIEAEAGESCTAADRIRLDQRITDIKSAAIQLHINGHLEDADELPSLLVTLADARTRIWGGRSS